MLCMQPLEHWVHEAIEPAGFWMYHGHGGGMKKETGPASWFIVSEKDVYNINKWKESCDYYWQNNNSTTIYFWMDMLFKDLFNNDDKFKQLWSTVPYLYCELDGQSHTLAHYKMENDTPHIKKIFLENPPYALKFWKDWNNIFPDINTEKCKKSNGYYAILMSKRKIIFKHNME